MLDNGPKRAKKNENKIHPLSKKVTPSPMFKDQIRMTYYATGVLTFAQSCICEIYMIDIEIFWFKVLKHLLDSYISLDLHNSDRLRSILTWW